MIQISDDPGSSATLKVPRFFEALKSHNGTVGRSVNYPYLVVLHLIMAKLMVNMDLPLFAGTESSPVKATHCKAVQH